MAIIDSKNSAGNILLVCVYIVRVCIRGPRSEIPDLHKITNANLVFILTLISLMYVISSAALPLPLLFILCALEGGIMFFHVRCI